MKNMKFILSKFIALLMVIFINEASAFTYGAATKTARMTAVVNQIDLGSTAGVLEIGPVGMASVCVSVTLNKPSGTVSGSALTLAGFPKIVTASGTCIAGEARIKDSNGTAVITGLTVGLAGSGANIIADNTSINSTQSVTVNASPVITHAP